MESWGIMKCDLSIDVIVFEMRPAPITRVTGYMFLIRNGVSQPAFWGTRFSLAAFLIVAIERMSETRALGYLLGVSC